MSTKLSITASGTALPSPVSIKTSIETIWSSDTARASSGLMKGKVIDTKRTVEVKWSYLTESEMKTIYSKCPTGFFEVKYYEMGATKTITAYRSPIEFEQMQAGNEVRYKDVSIQFIEQ